MTARIYRRGVPAPPKDLAAAMGEAGKTGDTTRLGLLQDAYEQWLEEQGYRRPTLGRPQRADEAAQ